MVSREKDICWIQYWFHLIVTVSTVFCHLTGETVFASPQNDFYIRQALDRYFVLPQDAESLSMAGASGASCKSSQCIYLNPAGLGFLDSAELSLEVGQWSVTGDDLFGDGVEQSAYNGFVTAALPLGQIVDERPRFGTIAIGYSRYNGETDDQISTSPDGHRRSIAYGYSPLKDLSLGYSFTFYDDQLHSELADLHSHARLLHIWGAQFKFNEGWELSSTIRFGIGQSDTEDFRFNSNGLSHPREYGGALAVSKTIESLRIALAVDYSRVKSRGTLNGVDLPVPIGGSEEGDVYNIRLGLEKTFYEKFIVRAGLRWHEVLNYEFKREDLRDLSGTVTGLGSSGGIGYRYRRCDDGKDLFRLDYGFEYLSIGSGAWQQLITLSVPLKI